MSNARFFSAIGFTAIVTTVVVASLTLSRPARADTPRVMECMPIPDKPVTSEAAYLKQVDTQIAWANQKLTAGKMSFGAMPVMQTSTILYCAW